MSGTIFRAHNWDFGYKQLFLAVNPLGDEVLLYQTNDEDPGIGYNELTKISSRGGFDNIQCSSYSYISPGLTGVGCINGTVHIFDMLTTNSSILKLRPKQSRPCNSISFNNNGWVAVCFDKGRQDNSLQLWNIEHYSRTSDNDHIKRPTYSYLPNEAVLSTCFVPEKENSLLAGSYKLLREFDLRNEVPAFQIATKCTLGITFDHFQHNIFSTYSEDGSLAIWDRRKLTSNSGKFRTTSNPNVMTESPILQFPKLLSDSSRKNHNPCLRYSSVRKGEFSSVFKGDLIRRWHTGSVPHSTSLLELKPLTSVPELKATVPLPELKPPANYAKHSKEQAAVLSSLKQQSSQLYKPSDDSLFVSLVLDVKTDYERVISFDYSPDLSSSTSTNFVCMRQSGSVFRMPVIECIENLDFNSYNEFSLVGPEGACTQFLTDIPDQRPTNNGPTAAANGTDPSHDEPDGKVKESSAGSGPEANHKALDDYYDMRRDSEAEYSEDISSTAGDEEYGTRRSSHRHPPYGEGAEWGGNGGDFSSDLVSPLDLHEVLRILAGDICFTMRKRAIGGYSLDCDANVRLLEQFNGLSGSLALRNTWKWVSLAKKSLNKGTMISQGLDLGYQGVYGIWNGAKEIGNDKRYSGPITDNVFNQTVKSIVSGKGKKTAGIKIPNNSDRKAQRKLCLIVSGWYFTDDELDERLNLLIKLGFVEKAAGWAVFHGYVNRAIEILAASKKEKLNLVSTAIAGYLAYKDSNVNSPWKDQCRKMASDLSDPYLRAIFAFIADNDWWDVLDEHSLPLRERLGIALRFLSDKDLSVYLNRVADMVVNKGELEGLLLTGITGRGIDLLQSYVDRTSDVQTAALITAYGVPRYFEDERVDHWIDCYRRLLNSWGLFSLRAKFDVTRTKLSKNFHGQFTIKSAPKQVYLQCLRCNKNISKPKLYATNSDNSASIATTASNTPSESNPNSILLKQFNKLHMKPESGQDLQACPHCGAPLPRCSICLLTLGTPIPSDGGATDNRGQSKIEANFRSKFSFCLSCNHGAHAYHAEEWFSKHYVCPVPDCNCRCNSK